MSIFVKEEPRDSHPCPAVPKSDVKHEDPSDVSNWYPFVTLCQLFEAVKLLFGRLKIKNGVSPRRLRHPLGACGAFFFLVQKMKLKLEKSVFVLGQF